MKNNAIEEFYKQYHNDVFLYALSLCNNFYEAESLTSDTFYKALLNVGNIKSNAKYWLLKVCKNTYIDKLRSHKHLKENYYDPNEVTDNISILDTLIKNEDTKALYKAILKLNNPYRECVLLYYFHRYPMKEIAQMLNISAGSVRTIIYRSRIKLKQNLKEVNHEL